MSDLHQSLHDSAVKGDVESVRRLLKQGASPLWANPLCGSLTSLHRVMETENTECLELLLRSALSSAIQQGDLSCVDVIVSAVSAKCQSPLPLSSRASLPPSSAEYSQLPLETRVERAVAAIARGEFVVVMDGEDRENEGDLIIAAEKATPEHLAFMVNETSGIICVGLAPERVDELKLPQMVIRNTESHQTAFTHSVDYKIGTSTGISAADRAITIRALADKSAKAEDFARPGHVFPLRAREGGVLVRPGHTEASVDLARLAGLAPAGVLCELVNKDGSMSRAPVCKEFAKRHRLEWLTIEDLIAYRKLKETSSSSSSSVPSTTPPVQDSVATEAKQSEPQNLSHSL